MVANGTDTSPHDLVVYNNLLWFIAGTSSQTSIALTGLR